MSDISSASVPLAGDAAILAGRYVDALYELAEQQGVVDATVSDMIGLRTLWNECAEWRFLATDPRLRYEDVCSLALEVGKISGVGKLVENFLSVIAQNRRLSLLPILIEKFVEEVGVRRGEFVASVRTAHSLTQTQREKLASLLSAATGGKVRLAEIEDPSIIGGLTIKVGSQFVDASVKTKLDRLERSLRETGAAA